MEGKTYKRLPVRRKLTFFLRPGSNVDFLILTGRQLGGFFEGLIKSHFIVIADFVGNVNDIHVHLLVIIQYFFGFLNPVLVDELVKTHFKMLIDDLGCIMSCSV